MGVNTLQFRHSLHSLLVLQSCVRIFKCLFVICLYSDMFSNVSFCDVTSRWQQRSTTVLKQQQGLVALVSILILYTLQAISICAINCCLLLHPFFLSNVTVYSIILTVICHLEVPCCQCFFLQIFSVMFFYCKSPPSLPSQLNQHR